MELACSRALVRDRQVREDRRQPRGTCTISRCSWGASRSSSPTRRERERRLARRTRLARESGRRARLWRQTEDEPVRGDAENHKVRSSPAWRRRADLHVECTLKIEKHFERSRRSSRRARTASTRSHVASRHRRDVSILPEQRPCAPSSEPTGRAPPRGRAPRASRAAKRAGDGARRRARGEGDDTRRIARPYTLTRRRGDGGWVARRWRSSVRL